METLWKDLRYGFRVLLQNPGFAAVAILALALGIGANTTIFSIVNSVLLKPLPYKNSDRLLTLRETKLPQFPEFAVSPGDFLDWQKQADSFEQICAYRRASYSILSDREPERVKAARVTAGMFTMLGVPPLIGDDVTPEQDRPGVTVAFLSYALWQRRFAADPDVKGRTINLNGTLYTIVGVMPPSFRLPDRDTDLWTPMAFQDQERQAHGAHYISAMARLKPDATLAGAQAEMHTIAGRLQEQYPGSNQGWDVSVESSLDYTVKEIRPSLLLLLGAVACVLLIACANVANLLLARAATRDREMAIRSALGAGRWRVVRQLLTESLLLGVAGGTLGLLLSMWGIKTLLALAPQTLPRVQDSAIDGRALIFTMIITLVTAVLFGLVPALQSSRPRLAESLKEGGRGTGQGAKSARLRGSLVALEVALSFILLAGAGLLIKSFWRLQQVDPGFQPQNALSLGINLPVKKYSKDEQVLSFVDQLNQRISVLPGVRSVGEVQSLPIVDDYILGFEIQGQTFEKPSDQPNTNYYAVTPGYFPAMGIPLRRGRLFDDHDKTGSPRVAVINESMAARFFPDEDPIGKRMKVTNGVDDFREIVGIVGDIKQYGLERETPVQFYEPFAQNPFSSSTVVVRTDSPQPGLGQTIRTEVLAVDSEQPVSNIAPLEQILADSNARRRFSMILLSVFATAALLLASIGLYGIMSYSVTQRTHEIGIRMALGAGRKGVLRLVLGYAATLASIGLVCGLGVSFALRPIIAGLLFKVNPIDWAIFGGISVALSTVAMLASFIPALRATRVDPMIALRYE